MSSRQRIRSQVPRQAPSCRSASRRAARAGIKRPDFLVGIPPIGTLAFDVKAKSVYDHHILIDAGEHAALLLFEQLFSIPVWFVCFPPGGPHACHLFMNRKLAGIDPVTRAGEACIAVPLKRRILPMSGGISWRRLYLPRG